ncbi:VPLPA-CTERM sorting domain-containing protein [Dongia sedimenti]|uniref:VPLPA-CTERM sorting domain-containing protein n=1 Tax=Dongia sedimenti TaxID=3064282 RepID=A0ABU0YGG4_9PROT|nr:VPLPA-CTERM sorting domain-containing protein [Rhodospirillaceae bacterium R-7]
MISFSATGFNAGAPIDPVVGSFTITYDPAVSVTNVTGAAIHQNYLNINLGSAIAFSYNAAVQGLTIGGISQGANGFPWGSNDFFFALTGLTENSFYSLSPNLSYTQSDPNAAYNTFNVSVTVAPAAVTPIPASALLFLTALGGLGFAGVKRRRTAA